MGGIVFRHAGHLPRLVVPERSGVLEGVVESSPLPFVRVEGATMMLCFPLLAFDQTVVRLCTAVIRYKQLGRIISV